MRWETRATTVRAQMGVHNAHSLPLLLGVQVLIPKPWKLTAYLMIYGQHLRRLDVNSSHSNRTGDHEVWNERTHKHTFSDQDQDAVAYTPGDIPAVPTANVVGKSITVERSRRSVESRPSSSQASTAGSTRCRRRVRRRLDDRVQHPALLCPRGRAQSVDVPRGVIGHCSARDVAPLRRGDTVELIVKTVGDEVIVSDGGEVLARLDSVGVTVDSRSHRWHVWKRRWRPTTGGHRGQLVRRAGVEHTADLVREMADAVANLDGLRLLAPAPRRPAFPERLTTYLEAEFPFVEPRAELTGASGWPYRVTAAVGSSAERPVYLQTASGQNNAAQKSAVEHCFTMFSDVNGNLLTERKLVVLDDEATPEWRPEMINLLSSVAYVGTWTARDQWTEFVWGNLPESRLMLPSEQPTHR